MSHSVADIEYHLFQFASHPHPEMFTSHFLGADLLSFGSGLRLQDGDLMEVWLDGFGRALRNPVQGEGSPQKLQLTTKTLR